MFGFFWKKDKFKNELEKFLGFKVNDISLYKEALTHSSKKLNYNYQRLEFLGDAVLNLVVAEHVFKNYQQSSEGDLSKLRTRLVNKHILKEVAIALHLNKWMIHQLSSTELEKSSIYCDILESLIGAIYIDKGMVYADRFILSKIIKQLDEVIIIEDKDYKSKMIQLAQKNKWNLMFQLEGIEKNNNENIFHVTLILNGKKIGQAQHYNKKEAEQMAAKQGLENLNV